MEAEIARLKAETAEVLAENKKLKRELIDKVEELREALNGAHRVIRKLRDGDSILPPE